MASYTQITYHIVFSTKNRGPVLVAERRKDLYDYIWGILKNKECFLHRIGGVADHLHILCGLHPTLALADLIRTIKVSSAGWIRDRRVFPDFTHWQEGYGAFTCSAAERPRLVKYIRMQEKHHQQVLFRDELHALLIEHGVKFDERYFR
ncbi:MAG: IS200/IS605 family transposase [Planctomycetota bacterium]